MSRYKYEQIIHDFTIDNDNIDGQGIITWWTKTFASYNDMTITQWQQAKRKINKYLIRYKSTIKQKINKIKWELKIQHINMKLLKMNMKYCHMLYQYCVYFEMYLNDQLNINYDTIECLCCNVDYLRSQVFDQRYVNTDETIYMIPCVSSEEFVCNYCLRLWKQQLLLHVSNDWYSKSKIEQTDFILRDKALLKFCKNISWYDLQLQIWRFGKILKIINIESFIVKILLSDTDMYDATNVCQLNLSSMFDQQYYIWSSDCKCVKPLCDDEFSIDAQNDHMIGWEVAKNRYTLQWKIPIIEHKTIVTMIKFADIRNSKQLFEHMSHLQ